MISCREVARLKGAFLALELDAGAEDELRAHLAGCGSCRAAIDAREPVLALARRLGEIPGEEDESFVAEVLAGVRQRRVERSLLRRRAWLGAAAAVLIAMLGGWVTLRPSLGPRATVASVDAAAAPAPTDAAFVEVEGEGVRLYQLTPASQDAVQVVFIIDPRLEL